MPNIYGGRLPKAYGTSMVVKLRKQFEALEQAFSFGNESHTTALTKSKPSGHVEVFARRKVGKSVKLITVVFVDFPWAVSSLIELDMPLRSVSLM